MGESRPRRYWFIGRRPSARRYVTTGRRAAAPGAATSHPQQRRRGASPVRRAPLGSADNHHLQRTPGQPRPKEPLEGLTDVVRVLPRFGHRGVAGVGRGRYWRRQPGHCLPYDASCFDRQGQGRSLTSAAPAGGQAIGVQAGRAHRLREWAVAALLCGWNVVWLSGAGQAGATNSGRYLCGPSRWSYRCQPRAAQKSSASSLIASKRRSG